MAPASLQHRRTHNLLLISKLLNQRDAASPFTLVLDSLEQSGRPLLAEYAKRAKAAKVKVIFVSFATIKSPPRVDVFIPAWQQTLAVWQRQVAQHTKPQPNQRCLLLIDSLNSLAASTASQLPAILSSFINPATSLLALYHTDVPLSSNSHDPYSPAPLTLLQYLATTLISTHSLPHMLARKAARERSVMEPSFGLEEGVEGILQGLGANGKDGLVLEMEHRRKSGRGVREWFFLPHSTKASSDATASPAARMMREAVILLEDHPAYRTISDETVGGSEEPESTTFELGLTEKQRQAREGVVLPYFDAQQGGGEGGRILYDIGAEDDFDEDEDEI